MVKLTREERKERKVLAKTTAAILKTSARSSKWRVARDSLFKDHKGWFIEVQATISGSERKTVAARIKPMALDPVFWDIAGTPENAKSPLSFRAFGAWVCGAPTVAEEGIDEGDGSAETIAAKVIAWADAQMNLPLLTADSEAYLDFLRTKGNGYFANLITMQCLMGRFEEARALCQAAVARDDSGGFMQLVGDNLIGFPTMVINWLERNGH